MVIIRSSRTQKKNTDMKKYKTPRKKRQKSRRGQLSKIVDQSVPRGNRGQCCPS